MISKISQSWSTLQSREKMTVVIGSVIVIVTALYLLFSGLLTARNELVEARRELIEERQWMQEQATLAGQLVNSCSESQFLALNNTGVLELLASRNNLVLANFRENFSSNNPSYSMGIESTDGNNILSFIHQSACQGFNLANVQIDKNVPELSYTAQVEFSHEG